MRSLLSFLGLGDETSAAAQSAADTATVRKIVERLESLPVERARYIAAFAYVLGRVAQADLDISSEETAAMESLVTRQGGLPSEQAVLVVEIAKSQNRLFGQTEDFLVTRQLGRMVDEAQRTKIVHCLFQVSTADGTVSADEEHQIRLIADELGMTPAAFLAVRATYNEHRSVIQRLDGDPA